MNKTAGFSILEMMIGLAVGLIVVAAATASVVNIIKSNREITDSARLNQELGAVIAVMSNEIRRAGFSVCNPAKDCNNDGVFDATDADEPFVNYTPGDTIKIGDGGKCIEYRYNADSNGDPNTLGEHRSFRFNNITNTIQIGDTTQNIVCTDIATPAKWVDLTDPNVVNITAMSFSTPGSRCRNNTQGWSLVVTGDSTTEMPCDTAPAPAHDCDPPGPCAFAPAPKIQQLFGNILITINLDAELTDDPAVSKSLKTSVKVANPRIEDYVPPAGP